MDTRDKNKTFPLESLASYITAYADQLVACINNMDKKKLEQAANCLHVAQQLGRRIFIAGNGGSASISEHMECDFHKGCHHGNTLLTRSLVSNVALLTAIANDIGYDEVFKYQLELAAVMPGEILILVSSSGNSPNILKALDYARAMNMTTIGFSGFGGGLLAKHVDISLHVPFENYGLVEDAHQLLFHCLAQYHYLKMKS